MFAFLAVVVGALQVKSVVAQIPVIGTNVRITAKPNRIPPKALAPAEKILRAQKLLASKGQKVNSLSSAFKLSTADLSAGINKGEAILWIPSIVGAGVAVFKDGGYVQLFFTPPAAGMFLVDVAVSANDAKTQIGFNGEEVFGSQTVGQSDLYGESPNSPKHLLFIFEAKQANHQMQFGIEGSKGEWTFYSVEISQIK
jgi:hypothetical protein